MTHFHRALFFSLAAGVCLQFDSYSAAAIFGLGSAYWYGRELIEDAKRAGL